MILPGYADSVDFLGYMIERCPDCQQTGIFAVSQAKRKLTITFITTPVNLQNVRLMECRTCGARFSVPKKWEANLSDRLMTQEQLSHRIRELRGNGGYLGSPTQKQSTIGDGKRTAYQMLQVDPSADADVIEAAFKRLALKSHPDRNESAESSQRMRELLEARDLLADPARRRGYDLSLGIVRSPDVYTTLATERAKDRRDSPTAPPPTHSRQHAPATRPRDHAPQRPSTAPPIALPRPGARPKAIRADEV